MGCTSSKPPPSKPKSPPAALPPKSPETSSPIQSDPRPVLRYFDVWGRAEVLRMAFHYTGISYIDERISATEWEDYKGRAEFQMLPIMEMDGKTMCQTRAILRYLCYKKGYYPANKKEAYFCESLCDLVEDMRSPLLQAYSKNDEVEIAKVKAQFPSQLLMIENRLHNSPEQGKAFFLGKSATMCDFMVFNFLWDNYLCKERNLAAEVPKSLQNFAGRMADNPGLGAYLRARESRPY